jgi:hypothetical protein
MTSSVKRMPLFGSLGSFRSVILLHRLEWDRVKPTSVELGCRGLGLNDLGPRRSRGWWW